MENGGYIPLYKGYILHYKLMSVAECGVQACIPSITGWVNETVTSGLVIRISHSLASKVGMGLHVDLNQPLVQNPLKMPPQTTARGSSRRTTWTSPLSPPTCPSRPPRERGSLTRRSFLRVVFFFGGEFGCVSAGAFVFAWF